jgi:hypothetical protein
MLAVLCGALVPWCWCSAWRGRLVGVSQPTQAALAMALTVAFVSAANWLWQIYRG